MGPERTRVPSREERRRHGERIADVAERARTSRSAGRLVVTSGGPMAMRCTDGGVRVGTSWSCRGPGLRRECNLSDDVTSGKQGQRVTRLIQG